jgi:hypothetical protein
MDWRQEAAAMKKATRRKKNPKRVLRLPDLDYAKGAVLNRSLHAEV